MKLLIDKAVSEADETDIRKLTPRIVRRPRKQGVFCPTKKGSAERYMHLAKGNKGNKATGKARFSSTPQMRMKNSSLSCCTRAAGVYILLLIDFEGRSVRLLTSCPIHS